MKKNILLLLATLSLPLSSMASRVAVTDSGTDFSHELLKPHMLINSGEIAGNRVDDDQNGKVDDVVGWNFVEDYGRVFFPEHLASVDKKTFQFFEVIARKQSGKMTTEDEAFWKANVTDLPAEQKKSLMAKLNFYGQYAHGTHVSGIIADLAPKSQIISARVFPDTPPSDEKSLAGGQKKLGLADIFYKIISAVNNGSFAKVGVYLKERNIDVANYSLGVSLQNIAKMTLGLRGIKNPTPEQISAETIRAAAQFTPQGQKWIASSPKTLFVIAAGNDGTNNDLFPTFPANVKAANAITVAATQDYEKLASFSNYGESVDIAAPGVAIISSVPSLDHKQMLPMSGTSMASPFLAGVAAKTKDLNPALTAENIKEILMSTVDKKDWLKAKVKAAGVVNPERAYLAAEKSKSMSLAEAIRQSQQLVKDVVVAPAQIPANKDFTLDSDSADLLVF